MPYIALSKQLDATLPPLAMESGSTQLPMGGSFVLTLGPSTPERTAEPTEGQEQQLEEPVSATDSLSSGLTDSIAKSLTSSAVDSLPVSKPHKERVRTVPHFSVGDTISISIYSLPTDYLDTHSLHFRLQELRIIAR